MDPESGTPVGVGEIVAGKYRVDRILGAGGMGVVVAATQVDLDRRVAIKFLLPAAMKNAEVVARFSREARAAAKIQSEHVARVIDVGSLPDGSPYMVMEHLEGTDLGARIETSGRVPLAEVVRYVLEACEALAEAHAAGIVHRDLKPANLFLARRPDRTTSIKVLDFGISKAPVGDAGITSTQAVMGSPLYMSPEQLVSAKRVDARADIWSLGVVMFEALTGAPPFNADSMPEIVARILSVPAPSVRESCPDLPPAVDAIVARCLAKDPGDRFKDVAELARALGPLTPDGPRLVERVSRVLGEAGFDETMMAPPGSAPSVVTGPAGGARPDTSWGATHPAGVPRGRSMALRAAAGAGALAMVGVAAFVALRSRSAPHDTAGAGLEVPAQTKAAATATPSADTMPVATLAPEPTAMPPASAAAAADSGAATASVPVRTAPARGSTPPRRTGGTPPTPPPAAPPAPSPPAAPTNPLSMPMK